MQVNQVSAARESLPIMYAEALANNPLLARIEAQCKLIYWTDREIRTMQLLTAIKSNASLQQRLKELELSLGNQYDSETINSPT